MWGFLTDYVLMFTPLIPGFCLAAILFSKTPEVSPERFKPSVLYSFSHLFGMLLFSLLIQLSLVLDFNIFTQHFVTGMLLLLGMSSGYLLFKSRRLAAQCGTIVMCHMAFVLLLVFFWGSQPVFGWDALKFWMPAAVELIETGSQNDIQWSSAAAFQHRHMATIPSFIAWAGWLFEEFSQQLLSFNAGFHFAFFLAIFAAYHWHKATGRVVFGVIGATALLTLPLMENHILISGYSEIWLSCYLVAAATAGVFFLEDSSLKNLLVFLTLGAGIAVLKNIGFIFAAMLVAWAGIVNRRRKQANPTHHKFYARTSRSLAVTGLLSGLVALAAALLIMDGSEYQIAGRRLTVQVNNPIDVLAFQVNALISNASYSLLIFLFTISAALWRQQRQINSPAASQDFMFLTVVSFYLMYSSGQLFTDYIYFYSAPTTDTSGSRLFLPIAALAMMCAPSIERVARNPHR